MDNPCKHCDKAVKGYIFDGEYGCDNPCQKAKDFFEQIIKKLDELYKKLTEIGGEG